MDKANIPASQSPNHAPSAGDRGAFQADSESELVDGFGDEEAWDAKYNYPAQMTCDRTIEGKCQQ
jgi:hypothetical protein